MREASEEWKKANTSAICKIIRKEDLGSYKAVNLTSGTGNQGCRTGPELTVSQRCALVVEEANSSRASLWQPRAAPAPPGHPQEGCPRCSALQGRVWGAALAARDSAGARRARGDWKECSKGPPRWGRASGRCWGCSAQKLEGSEGFTCLCKGLGGSKDGARHFSAAPSDRARGTS